MHSRLADCSACNPYRDLTVFVPYSRFSVILAADASLIGWRRREEGDLKRF